MTKSQLRVVSLLTIALVALNACERARLVAMADAEDRKLRERYQKEVTCGMQSGQQYRAVVDVPAARTQSREL
jgi:hypothetical protein